MRHFGVRNKCEHKIEKMVLKIKYLLVLADLVNVLIGYYGKTLIVDKVNCTGIFVKRDLTSKEERV